MADLSFVTNNYFCHFWGYYENITLQGNLSSSNLTFWETMSTVVKLCCASSNFTSSKNHRNLISTLLIFLRRVRWVWVSVCYNLFWLQTSKTQRWKPAARTKQFRMLMITEVRFVKNAWIFMILWFILLWSYDCLLHAYLTTDSD